MAASPTALDRTVDDRVLAIVVDVLCVDPEWSRSDACLAQDLGADSLDLVELEFALEEAFGLAFSGHDSGRLSRCITVADVARLVGGMLRRCAAPGEVA